MNHRRWSALGVALLALVGNALLDFLLVRRPDELEAQAHHVLRAVFPDYRVRFGETAFEGLSPVFHDVEVFARDDPSGRPLFGMRRIEVRGEGFPPRAVSLTVVEPQVFIAVDRDGRLSVGGYRVEPSGKPMGELPVDVHVSVVGGQVRLHNAIEGIDSTVLLTGITTELSLRRDLQQVEAQGGLRVGALFPDDQRPIPEEQPLEGLVEERFSQVAERLRYRVRRAAGGSTRVAVEGALTISQTIRSMIPPRFQVGVWDRLRPLGGRAELAAHVTLDEEGAHVSVGFGIEDARARPEGFPILFHDVQGGRFEVQVAVPPDQGPRLLAVNFQGLEALIGGPFQLDGRTVPPGRIRVDGSVFPGEADEGVTIGITAEVRDLALSPDLVEAIPPHIRRVYQLFDPQGFVPEARVQLLKAPYERDLLELVDGQRISGLIVPEVRVEGVDPVRIVDSRGEVQSVPRALIASVDSNNAPQVSAWFPRVGGGVSAAYVDVPARLTGVEGWFSLREGANVELEVEAQVALGGTARVRAQVMHGDLISVEVWAKDVPVDDRLVAVLPGRSKEMVAPFHLQGGTIDVHTRVEQTHPQAPGQPIVDVTLHGVSLNHDEFPLPAVADGELRVIPVFETKEQDEPSRIELELTGVRLRGESVEATASGTLVLPPRQAGPELEFAGDLAVAVQRVELEALPPLAQEILQVLGPPRGTATGVVGRVRGPRSFELRGRGRGIALLLEPFPYPLRADAFDLSLEGHTITLRHAEARAGAAGRGGTLRVRGQVELPRTEEGQAAFDLALEAEGLRVDPALIDAIPDAGTREVLHDLRPRGRSAASLQLLGEPGRPVQVRGDLELAGVTLYLDRFHEDLAPLAEEPVSELHGRVRLDPQRVAFSELRGRFVDSPVVAQGRVDIGQADEGQVPFQLEARLERIIVDARTRRLAGPGAAGFFQSFQVDGPAGLELRTFRRRGRDAVHVHVTALPAGLSVVPAVVPVPLAEVEGRVVIEDGVPVEVDVRGLLKPPGAQGDHPWPRLRVRRPRGVRWRFPEAGGRGQVYHASLQGLQRVPQSLPAERTAFERQLPTSWISTLTAMDPQGEFDVEAWVYQPDDEREPVRWVAEVDLRDVGLSAGLRYDGLQGTARVQGRLAEFELGSCEGRVRLEQLDLYEQTFREVRADFSVRQGVLSIGHRGAPFFADFYGGLFRGVLEYEFGSGRYRGWVGLGGKGPRDDAQLGEMMRELSELSSEPSRGPSIPYRGRLRASAEFNGGGVNGAGEPISLSGEGWMVLTDSNLLAVPQLDFLHRVVGSLQGVSTNAALENLELSFAMRPDRLRIRRLVLSGETITVLAREEYFTYTGQYRVLLVPFNTEGLYDVLKWVPLTGYTIEGQLGDDYTVSTLPALLNPFKWLEGLLPERR